MQTLSPRAGKPAPVELLVDVTKLERAYYDTSPDVEDPNQLIHFGTSGHRGSSLRASFNKLNIAIVNPVVDPTFSFMTVDHDGKIRMDPSSPYAMAGLVKLKDRYRVAFSNVVDADRHGIVTRSGLMNPNHYLSVAIRYLLTQRTEWPAQAAIGKTLVSSQMIDRVVRKLGRKL